MIAKMLQRSVTDEDTYYIIRRIRDGQFFNAAVDNAGVTFGTDASDAFEFSSRAEALETSKSLDILFSVECEVCTIHKMNTTTYEEVYPE